MVRFAQFTAAVLEKFAGDNYWFRWTIDNATSLDLVTPPCWNTSGKQAHLRMSGETTVSIELLVNGLSLEHLAYRLESALRDLLYPFCDRRGTTITRIKPDDGVVENELKSA